ncbi:MAG: hypothetical protein QOC63_324 [Mycobacterium sp.]|jgi:hypothetical protein|nr:hypothetical protein [Mycobacterium sp.]
MKGMRLAAIVATGRLVWPALAVRLEQAPFVTVSATPGRTRGVGSEFASRRISPSPAAREQCSATQSWASASYRAAVGSKGSPLTLDELEQSRSSSEPTISMPTPPNATAGLTAPSPSPTWTLLSTPGQLGWRSSTATASPPRLAASGAQRAHPQSAVGFDADHHLIGLLDVLADQLMQSPNAGQPFGQPPGRSPTRPKPRQRRADRIPLGGCGRCARRAATIGVHIGSAEKLSPGGGQSEHRRRAGPGSAVLQQN